MGKYFQCAFVLLSWVMIFPCVWWMCVSGQIVLRADFSIYAIKWCEMVGIKPQDVVPSAAVKFFGAGTAACIADLVTFPLDTAKVRLQVFKRTSLTVCYIKPVLKLLLTFHVIVLPRFRAREAMPWSIEECLVPSPPWCAQRGPGVFTMDWWQVSRGRWASRLSELVFMTPWSNSTLEALRVSIVVSHK